MPIMTSIATLPSRTGSSEYPCEAPKITYMKAGNPAVKNMVT